MPAGPSTRSPPAVRIRRVCPTLFPFLAGASEECNEPRQKTNGTARHTAHHPAHNIDNVTKALSLCHITCTQPLLLAIRNRLVDKFVECCALLGGADGAHDGLPYDVAVLVDNVGRREREQI